MSSDTKTLIAGIIIGVILCVVVPAIFEVFKTIRENDEREKEKLRKVEFYDELKEFLAEVEKKATPEEKRLIDHWWDVARLRRDWVYESTEKYAEERQKESGRL